MDWATRMMVKKMLAKILKLAKNFKGSKWEIELKQGKYLDFYAWCEQQFKDYVATLDIAKSDDNIE